MKNNRFTFISSNNETKTRKVMKTSKEDQAYIMSTAKLEVSIQENIDYDDLLTRPSVRNDGSWVVLQKSTKKVLFRKSFK